MQPKTTLFSRTSPTAEGTASGTVDRNAPCCSFSAHIFMNSITAFSVILLSGCLVSFLISVQHSQSLPWLWQIRGYSCHPSLQSLTHQSSWYSSKRHLTCLIISLRGSLFFSQGSKPLLWWSFTLMKDVLSCPRIGICPKEFVASFAYWRTLFGSIVQPSTLRFLRASSALSDLQTPRRSCLVGCRSEHRMKYCESLTLLCGRARIIDPIKNKRRQIKTRV